MSATRNYPRHIAIVMDGNGRWAQQRHLPRVAGHKAGAESVREVVKICIEKHIDVLTLFAFSSENWNRPASEVNYLMQLFITLLRREAKKLHKQHIQLRVIGDRSRLELKLQEQIAEVENLTKNNSGLKLILAVNYGGQWDITQALKLIAEEIKNNTLSSENITAQLIQSKLCLADLPAPDLFIRTSGEQRISNFMLWQFSYTELHFTHVLWPDFKRDEFEKALESFANRERRFGLTSDQLKDVYYA
ncbi:MAG: isoprenyl transferase [Gammaproteobacteria bacterium]|nr:isoprenyl transferase [Gammaproteobacteria bacterium]